MEEAHGCLDFKIPIEGEVLDFGSPRQTSFEEEGDPGAVNTSAVNDDQNVDVVIIDAPEQRTEPASETEEPKE